MNTVSASDLLSQLNQLSERIDTNNLIEQLDKSHVAHSFTDLMRDTMQEINSQQLTSSEMGTQYQLGNKEIDTAALMIQIQKARVSFEALNQFRNQAVSAYQDIMNMQV